MVGTDRKISLFETAEKAKELVKKGQMAETLDSKEKARHAADVSRTACHIAEVEIDPDTGTLDLVRYTAVDDCGNIAQPDDRRGPGAGLARQRPWPGADRKGCL